jgi:FAD-dependent sensor of blue light
MLRLIYVSAAANQTCAGELPKILAKARARNQTLDVTGMLLHKDGNFLQALEGKGSAVRELFETIRRDPRHKGITVVLHAVDDKRLFGQSAMGFKDLTNVGLPGLPDFAPFLNTSTRKACLQRNFHCCMELLRHYGEGE